MLLTGFEPFGGAAENPSWTAVRDIAAEWDGEARVVAELLPVEFDRSVAELEAAIERHSPHVVIATGLAEGRHAITPERRGLNRDDARIPDNAGARPTGTVIDPDGPGERWSDLPVDAIVAAISAVGIPAEASLSAGGFVCNRTLYRLLALTEGTPVRAGFIHVPATPETGLGPAVPTLPASMIASALRIAIDATIAEPHVSGSPR